MQTLQDHFGEVLAAQGRGDSTAASLHDGVVTAALGKPIIHHMVYLLERKRFSKSREVPPLASTSMAVKLGQKAAPLSNAETFPLHRLVTVHIEQLHFLA